MTSTRDISYQGEPDKRPEAFVGGPELFISFFFREKKKVKNSNKNLKARKSPIILLINHATNLKERKDHLCNTHLKTNTLT
jgi:hypothetical protein